MRIRGVLLRDYKSARDRRGINCLTIFHARLVGAASGMKSRRKGGGVMRRGWKSSGIITSGLVSCLALTLIAGPAPASALNRGGPAPSASKGMGSATWTPDNGNGTFTNPLFYDEFSDPDLIRVGD